MMNNTPKAKIGIVAVSRDCFPESLSVNRRKALVAAYKAKYNADDIYECPVCIVESETQMLEALADIKARGDVFYRVAEEIPPDEYPSVFGGQMSQKRVYYIRRYGATHFVVDVVSRRDDVFDLGEQDAHF